jgi:hypothetical protein
MVAPIIVYMKLIVMSRIPWIDERERERERERGRQRDRDGETERQIETDRERDRETDRERDRERQRDREARGFSLSFCCILEMKGFTSSDRFQSITEGSQG